MIVPREQAERIVAEDIDEGDVRSMSPRRNSAEVDKLGEAARRDLIEQAKVLQTSLQAIVDRVEEVKSEHEKLEGGNKFLQSYVLPRSFHYRNAPLLTQLQIYRRTHVDIKDHLVRSLEKGQRPQWQMSCRSPLPSLCITSVQL